MIPAYIPIRLQAILSKVLPGFQPYVPVNVGISICLEMYATFISLPVSTCSIIHDYFTISCCFT